MSETVPQFSPPFFDFKYAKSVPHDWNWISLSDVVEPKQWQNLSQSSFLERGFPVYGANGQIGFYSEYNHEKPVIAVSCRGACGDIHLTKPFSYVTSNAMCLDNISDEVDEKFLYFGLIYRTLQDTISGSAQPQITGQSLQKVKFPAPPLQEQKKIASILTSVDEVIETTQKQIDKLQDLKKATMNELLTKGIGHTEFKDSELGRIPKSWEVSIVKDYIVDMTSGWSPDCLPEPAVGSQWGILKTTSVTWNGFDISENKVLPSHLDGRAQISLKAGDVLVTRAGPIDRVGVVAFCNETYPKIMLSDKIIRIQSKSDELMGEFLSIWLGSYAAQQNMRSKISGMAEAQSNISQDILKSTPMPLPNLSEQRQIVQILRSLDMRIGVQKQKLIQTQSLKKSLMQDLLTGKVRVQVN